MSCTHGGLADVVSFVFFRPLGMEPGQVLHLLAHVFPISRRERPLLNLLDDHLEVMKTCDRRRRPTVEPGDIFAAGSDHHGVFYHLERDPFPLEVSCQPLLCRTKVPGGTTQGREQLPD